MHPLNKRGKYRIGWSWGVYVTEWPLSGHATGVDQEAKTLVVSNDAGTYDTTFVHPRKPHWY